jgi:peptidoglycan/xylan/chitin deacetylase (PgdA/CDA1 family)
VQAAGHSVGNHTHNHLNGWKVSKEDYMENIRKAETLIPGRAFRPPYGRISRGQAKALLRDEHPWKIYMWTILSGDFDTKLSPERCLSNILDNLAPGAIVVFHDSAKAWDRLRYALPFVLDYCKEKGWDMQGLPMS